jgi:hypothetical protein
MDEELGVEAALGRLVVMDPFGEGVGVAVEEVKVIEFPETFLYSYSINTKRGHFKLE